MRTVIFNADDFAFTPGVSRGIVAAHRNGVVRSTSLMVNSPLFGEAVTLLKETPSLDVGLHLTLTWGTPLLPPDRVRSLVTPEGRFYPKPRFVPPTINLSEVDAELSAQIERALAAGLPVSHLDSHHHLHAFRPELFDLFLELAQRYRLALRSLSPLHRDAMRRRGIPTPDHFVGTFYGKDQITLAALQALLAPIPDGVAEMGAPTPKGLVRRPVRREGTDPEGVGPDVVFVEVMCHPAEPDERLRAESSYVEERRFELNLLTSRELRRWLDQERFVLAGYPALESGRGAST